MKFEMSLGRLPNRWSFFFVGINTFRVEKVVTSLSGGVGNMSYKDALVELDMAGLTAKQAQFVYEYLIDLNATQAAIRAGYSADTARQMGAENLSKPSIKKAIETAMRARQVRTMVSADRIIEQLSRIAFADMCHYAVWGGKGEMIDILPSDQVDGAAIKEITETVTDNGVKRTLKLKDSVKALELLMRHNGMLDGNKHALEIRKLELAEKRLDLEFIKSRPKDDGEGEEETESDGYEKAMGDTSPADVFSEEE